MIPKELDDLIKEYLTDGIISPQERKVLLRKAEALGLDIEEIDLYITAQEQKVEKKEVAAAEQKFGKRCPQCGRQVESMTVRCECGYEFRSEKAVSSVQKLYDDLNNIQLTDKEYQSCTYEGKPVSTTAEKVEKIKREKKLNLISTFPIPNTKEDIIEFLAMAAPNSKMKGGLFGTLAGRLKIFVPIGVLAMIIIVAIIEPNLNSHDKGMGWVFGAIVCVGTIVAATNAGTDIFKENKIAEAWRAKFDQALMKGRSMRGDSEFQQQLDYYENMINTK